MQPLTPKEQRILNFIQSYSADQGYPPTYTEIQREFEYRAVSSVQQFIQQLTDKGYLEDTIGGHKKRALQLEANPLKRVCQIPLEGQVAAGYLTEAVHNREYISIPEDFVKPDEEYFALTVKGDSMIEDCIMDGDIVVIRRQMQASNGQTVVALVGDEATIKRYYKKPDRIELHPANPDYDVIKVPKGADFSILGVLTNVIRNVA